MKRGLVIAVIVLGVLVVAGGVFGFVTINRMSNRITALEHRKPVRGPRGVQGPRGPQGFRGLDGDEGPPGPESDQVVPTSATTTCDISVPTYSLSGNGNYEYLSTYGRAGATCQTRLFP